MSYKRKVILGIRGKVSGTRPSNSGKPPLLGNVARMPRNYELETKKLNDRGKYATGKQPSRLHVILWVVLGLVVCGTPIALWIQSRLDLDEEITAARPPQPKEEVRVANVYQAPKEAEAIGIIKQALAVRNVADLKKHIRLGDASAREVIDFLGALDEKEGKAQEFDWLAGMDANGMQIEGVLVKLGEKNARLALLTPDDSGIWHMDFDSFSRKVSPDWQHIMSTTGGDALVRVYVGRDAYYNGEFSDETLWKCYALASPDNDTLIMGYVKPGSAQHIALESILAGKSLSRAVVKIRRDENMGPRQFVIREVTAEDWVVGNAPYDKRFSPNTGMLAAPAPMGAGLPDREPAN